jgi:hypothetical protein
MRSSPIPVAEGRTLADWNEIPFTGAVGVCFPYPGLRPECDNRIYREINDFFVRLS